MLRIHRCEGDRLVAQSLISTEGLAASLDERVVWLDLSNSTPEEDAYVERTLGISLPSREEMQEIEVSARLYNEGGAEFMTITAIAMLDSDDPLTKLRESLVSINRLLTYHSAVEEARARIKSLHRDAIALGDQSNFHSNKNNFLLDATLGFINLEQNQIIKIFSIVAVVLMPPTLVASIYGMNFSHMPELKWAPGYPMALLLMAVTAAVPYLWFKREGRL